MSQILLQESTKSTTDSEWSAPVDTPVASVQEKDVPKKWWQRSSQNKQQLARRELTRAEIIRYALFLVATNMVAKIVTKSGEKWLSINVAPLVPPGMGWLNGLAWFAMMLLAVGSTLGIVVSTIILWTKIKKKRSV